MSFRIKLAVVVGFAVLAFGAGYGFVAEAYPAAGLWKRAEYRGYFQNTYDDAGTYVWAPDSTTAGCKASGGNALPTTVDTATEFINFVHCKYNNGTTREKIGAAFIVQTMIHPMSSPVYDSTPSAADWAKWDDTIRYSFAAGLVRTKFAMPFTFNSYLQKGRDGVGPNDDAFHDEVDTQQTIAFLSGSKVVYAIKYFCANPVGNSNFAPPPAPPNYIIRGYTTPSVPAASTAAPGSTVHFYHYLKNIGTTNVSGVTWVTQNTRNANQQTFTGSSGSIVAGNATGVQVKDEAVTIPLTAASGSQVCRRVGGAPTEWDVPGYTYGTEACITVGFNPGASCGGLTVNPGAFGPKDTFTLTGVVSETGGGAAAQAVKDQGGTFYINISGPYNKNNTGLAPTVGPTGTLTAAVTAGPTNAVGSFTVHYGITGPIGAVDCPGEFSVAYTPYFSVRGGDVAVGPGFGTACIPKLSGIRADNLGAGAGYFGAGTELAAMSLGTISKFATNTTLDLGGGTGGVTAMVGQPSGLAFANAGANAINWGTTYGKDPAEDPVSNSSWCVPDYYGAATSGDTEDLGGNTLDQSMVDSGLLNDKVYTTTGTTTIAGSTLTMNGGIKRLTLVVKGDVIITADVNYGGYNYSSATGNITDIPQFQLLVLGGNIYVDERVTTLTGFYHAQAAGGVGGTIYTCSTGNKYLSGELGGPANALYSSTYYNDCNKKLTVLGSLSATDVKLLRTGGNLQKITGPSGVSNDPAEQIIYTPELWMGSLTNSSAGVGPFDSITSLPPIF